LAVAFAALATVNVAHWLLHQPARPAWVAGLMVGLGYLTHLCLDEIYSVDIFNTRMRRSFGTALKPFSFSDPVSTLLMGTAVAGLTWIAPAPALPRLPPPRELMVWADQTLAQLSAWSVAGVEMLRVWLN
jgi:hypothetical protein